MKQEYVYYNTDWKTLTCGCPDWTKRRSSFVSLDPRRMCKHLVEDFKESGAFAEDADLEDLFYEVHQFIEDQLIIYDDECEDDDDYERYMGFPLGQLCRTNVGMVIFMKGKKWAHVIDNSSPYLYNYEEDRWAFKETMSPQAPAVYRKLIGRALNGQSIEGALGIKIPSK